MAQPLPVQPQPEPEVAARLQTMGLASDDLREAVQNANTEALEYTSNDVVSRAGYTRWASPLRQLGDTYASTGFKRKRPKNFELLVSPDGTFGVTVAPGDANTGTDKMPSTRIERGPLTGQAVVGNRGQLAFGTIDRAFDKDAMKIWLLLTYFDELEEEIRLELSFPVEFSTKSKKKKRGFVTAFEPRLILPSIPLVEDQAGRDDEDEDGQIDVPVARR
jgi:hypothetical protein